MANGKGGAVEAVVEADYDSALADVVQIIRSARGDAARSVNALMTATYWAIGRRIVEQEQRGAKRAGYGDALLCRLAVDLTRKVGRGYSRQNLQQMRQFYLAKPARQIRQTLSGKLARDRARTKCQTPSGISLRELLGAFPLPWSHYVRLLSVGSPKARAFYEAEALRGGWTVRQLDRQVETQFYERTMLSRNKGAMLTRGADTRPGDGVSPEEALKSPYVLEFLDLKDEYSEGELEGALVEQLETFLLELGSEFAFVGRQRRLRIDDEWFKVDLLLFHRRLRCLVVIDLKLGRFTHTDAGQMHLYLNYARENWVVEGENPPVGLILCAHRSAAVARYALEGLPNKIVAAEYRTRLPDERVLEREVERTRRSLEAVRRRAS